MAHCFLGYNPNVVTPRIEESTLRTWYHLRDTASQREGLTVSQAWQMRGLLVWLAHCTVLYT